MVAALGLDALSRAQGKAVTSDPSMPLQILAGPGSGKTRVLTTRVAWLVHGDEHRAPVPPERCVVVTFTNKAAREMQQRLSALIGADTTARLVLGTFHATCARFLRQHGRRIGLENNFTIADADDAKRVMREVVKSHEEMIQAKGIQLKPEQALAEVSRAKARSLSPATFRARGAAGGARASAAQQDYHVLVSSVYEDYQARLAELQALDFDDLLTYGVRLLREHPDVVRNVEHVLVDEFQDTNAVQYELMTLFAAARRHISIVGDPDQSIYGWRNAEAGNLARMKQDFPELREVYLEENFRSTSAILDASLKVVQQGMSNARTNARRIDKGLYTSHVRGTPVTLRTLPDSDTEAEFIALEIQRQLALSASRLNHADVGILLRFNALSRPIEAALHRAGIPYRVVGGAKFFDRAEVKDLLAYMLLADNGSYTPAFVRIVNVPRRGIGPKSVQDIIALARLWSVPALICAERLVDGELPVEGFANVRTATIRALAPLVETLRRLRRAAEERVSMAELLQLVISELDYESHLRREPDFESRWENVQELMNFAAVADQRAAEGGGSTGGKAPPNQAAEAASIENPADLPIDEAESLRSGYTSASAAQKRDAPESDVLLAKRSRTEQPSTPPDAARMSPSPLRAFLENSILATDLTSEQDTSGKVTISTCHAAKGLEWPVVFVPAVENDTFPFYRSRSDEQQREERRLLYVAMTRAETNLYLTSAAERMVAGEHMPRQLSPFLTQLVPMGRGGVQSSSAPPRYRVDWCFSSPALDASQNEALVSVLGRRGSTEGELEACRKAFDASAPGLRLRALQASGSQPSGWQSATPRSSPSAGSTGPGLALGAGILSAGRRDKPRTGYVSALGDTRPTTTAGQGSDYVSAMRGTSSSTQEGGHTGGSSSGGFISALNSMSASAVGRSENSQWSHNVAAPGPGLQRGKSLGVRRMAPSGTGMPRLGTAPRRPVGLSRPAGRSPGSGPPGARPPKDEHS